MDNRLTTELLSPELRFLILCSIDVPTLSDKNIIKNYIIKGINWDHFIFLMTDHRLCGPVYKTLNHNVKHDVPRAILNRIKTLYLNNITKGLKNAHEAITISKAFSEKGIHHLFLKGVCLSQFLYNNAGFRHSGDIDLIIHEDMVDTAGKILESYGYRQVQSQKQISKDNLKLLITLNHHLKYRSEINNTELELHWKLSPINEAFPVSFEELLANKRHIPVSGYDLPVPGEIHTLTHLLYHGSKHAWKRLFWLKDIGDFTSKTNISDALLFSKSRELGILRPVAEGFYLSNLLYGTTIPELIKNYSQTDKQITSSIQRIFYLYMTDHGPISILINHFHGLFLLKSFKYMYSYIKHIFLVKKNKYKFNPGHKSRFLRSVKNKLLL